MATSTEIYLEWDILYESTKTKKQRNKVVKTLLDNIQSADTLPKGTIPLKYELFKSQNNKLLYVLRVYKTGDSTKTVIKKPTPVTSRSARAMSVVVDTDSGEPSADFSGPIRPNGPPSTPPPGVMSLSVSFKQPGNS